MVNLIQGVLAGKLTVRSPTLTAPNSPDFPSPGVQEAADPEVVTSVNFRFSPVRFSVMGVVSAVVTGRTTVISVPAANFISSMETIVSLPALLVIVKPLIDAFHSIVTAPVASVMSRMSVPSAASLEVVSISP